MTKLGPQANADAQRIDYWLMGTALLMASMGLIMVLSASGVMAERFYGDTYIFFKKQALFFLLGVSAMAACARIPRYWFYNLIYLWLFGSAILLGLTLSPLGFAAGGARRWISIGSFSIQPMEFTKLALVFYLAYFFSRKQDLVRSFSVGFVPPLMVTGLLCGLLVLQPDFGGAVGLAGILFFMCLVGGTRISYLLLSLAFSGGLGWMMIAQSPYRLKRWTAFLNPFETALNEGYQLVQSLYAFGSGQVFGNGLGAGKQKLFFLPEAHNDFIMAVVGEELGFVGVSVIMLCVGFLLYRAFRIAYGQQDLQDRFTAYGMALVLGMGFFLNLAVVMGTVPPKGVPMPFMSYGGSSLLVSFICIGVLLNLSRTRNAAK